MATTVVSWVSSGLTLIAGSNSSLSRAQKGQHSSIHLRAFPFLALELQHLILQFVPPSKLWTNFRRVSHGYKYVIEEIIAPRWLQRGMLTMFVELADIPLKDWKFLVEKGMMYGPSVVTPGCVRALSALQDDSQKVVPFRYSKRNAELPRVDDHTPRNASFEITSYHGRDKPRDVTTRKMANRDGNFISVSFHPPASGCTLSSSAIYQNKRVRLSKPLSTSILEGTNWADLSMEVSWVGMLNAYFTEFEHQDAQRNQVDGVTARISRWHSY